jgi:hypothetical protein
MTDNQVRGVVLRRLYELRSHRPITTGYVKFDSVPRENLGRIFQQLAELGLIEWKPTYSALGAGHAKITAKGVDVVEGITATAAPIQIDQSHHVTISHSDHNIVGDDNSQLSGPSRPAMSNSADI